MLTAFVVWATLSVPTCLFMGRFIRVGMVELQSEQG